MSNIDKQALRQIAESVDRKEWSVLDNGDADYQVIASRSLERGAAYHSYQPVTNEISNKKIAAFIAAFNPKVALALLDELGVKEEQRANCFQMAQKLGEDLDAAEKRNAEQREYYEGVIADVSKRIAELEEARTVVVNQLYDFQIVRHGATEDYAKGYVDCQRNYNKAIYAAGIKVKGE
ncbi:ead/Ea22-like family protein [Salmonella enterica]